MALGVALILWGVWLLLGTADGADFINIGLWLGGGVIAHDVLIAAITIAIAALVSRVLPKAARAPATVGLVVLGGVTLVAIPMLGRFGAREDNPTLLDRNYTAGYLLIVAIVVVSVVVASIVASRRSTSRQPASTR
ncbi:MAG: hypothetical protein WA991_17320 [Ornithinimicrobium sp.]